MASTKKCHLVNRDDRVIPRMIKSKSMPNFQERSIMQVSEISVILCNSNSYDNLTLAACITPPTLTCEENIYPDDFFKRNGCYTIDNGTEMEIERISNDITRKRGVRSYIRHIILLFTRRVRRMTLAT